MIRWNNGEKVRVRTSHFLGDLVLTWQRSSTNSSQIEMIDKTGALYYASKGSVTLLIPDDIDKTNMKELMIIDPEDLYQEPPQKERPKRVIYKAKKYSSERRRKAAYKKK